MVSLPVHPCLGSWGPHLGLAPQASLCLASSGSGNITLSGWEIWTLGVLWHHWGEQPETPDLPVQLGLRDRACSQGILVGVHTHADCGHLPCTPEVRNCPVAALCFPEACGQAFRSRGDTAPPTSEDASGCPTPSEMLFS